MVAGVQVSPLACISRNKVTLQRRVFKNIHQDEAAQVSARVCRPCCPNMWAHSSFSSASRASGDPVTRLSESVFQGKPFEGG